MSTEAFNWPNEFSSPPTKKKFNQANQIPSYLNKDLIDSVPNGSPSASSNISVNFAKDMNGCSLIFECRRRAGASSEPARSENQSWIFFPACWMDNPRDPRSCIRNCIAEYQTRSVTRCKNEPPPSLFLSLLGWLFWGVENWRGMHRALVRERFPVKPIAQMAHGNDVEVGAWKQSERAKNNERTKRQERDHGLGCKFQRRHWFYVIPAIRRLPFPVWATGARNSNTTRERTSPSSASSSLSSSSTSSPSNRPLSARNSRHDLLPFGVRLSFPALRLLRPWTDKFDICFNFRRISLVPLYVGPSLSCLVRSLSPSLSCFGGETPDEHAALVTPRRKLFLHSQ